MSLLLFQSLQAAHADLLDKAQEAASSGTDYMDIALTPIFQYATLADEDTGIFEVDLMIPPSSASRSTWDFSE